jgi:hypothetical protein
MMRFWTILLMIVGCSMVTTDAHAIDTYMWGVGPRLGAKVLPGKYPIAFPKITESDFEDAKDPKDKTKLPVGLERVPFIMQVGADGVYYIDGVHRVGALFGVAFGKKYSDINFLGKYEFVMVEGSIDVLAGAGIGFGSMRFGGIDEEKLRVPYYPIRANIGLQLRDDVRAYQLQLWGQVSIPGNQKYTTADGLREAEHVGTAIALANYLSLGLEFTVYFGDFEPPSHRKRGGKKKKK